MGTRLVFFAAVFYGFFVAVAMLWAAVRGFELRVVGDSLAVDLGLGASTALVTVGSGLLAYRFLPVLRELADELAPRLVDGATPAALLLVSLFSGVGEEVFFRGAVQQEFGIVIASVAFGLLHVGPDRRYLLWTGWAILAGFVLGGLYAFTGGLLAPVFAHAAHNAGTLLIWKHSRDVRAGYRARGKESDAS